MKIIGIGGVSHGTGKSSLAELLALGITQTFNGRVSVRVLSFAEPLKEMLGVLIGSQVREKDSYSDILGGKTVRYALQTLGTEWGRGMIHKDIWLNILKERMAERPADVFIIDDVRFENELKFIKENGGLTLWLDRRGVEKDSHSSENELNSSMFDVSSELMNEVGEVDLTEWQMLREEAEWYVGNCDFYS